jgi:hypothetical protein
VKQYLLSLMQPDGPAPAHIGKIMEEVQKVDAEMRAAGVWVFNGGLDPASSATVVRTRAGDAPMTDGPYIEGKEHVGGFVIVKVEDLDEALKWARKVSLATTLPVEVRSLKFHG